MGEMGAVAFVSPLRFRALEKHLCRNPDGFQRLEDFQQLFPMIGIDSRLLAFMSGSVISFSAKSID